MPDPSTILLIQLRRIGDVLLATPVIRALRNAFPDARIHFLVETSFAAVVRNNPCIDELIVTRRKQAPWKDLALLADLRRRRFDLSVDLLGKPRTAVWSRLIGAHRRIGFDGRGSRYGYTDPVSPGAPGDYSVRHKAALLAPLGIRVDDLRLDFPVGPAARQAAEAQRKAWGIDPSRPMVVMAPGSRRADKRWPSERFAAVADRLADEAGMQPVFVCGPGEEPQVEAVRNAMRHRSFFSQVRPPLDQVQALLEHCALFVGNDTGLRHMAIAAGRPSVAVFGQPRAANWTPPDHPLHRSVEADIPCKSACIYPDCERECLLNISIEQVWSAVEDVLRAAGLDRSQAVTAVDRSVRRAGG